MTPSEVEAADEFSPPVENTFFKMASFVEPSHGETEAAEEGDVLAENPCLTRLRHKRLLAFLRGQRYDINALLHQAREEFSLEHMQRLVMQGLWEDAAGYLDSFLPAGPRSFDAQVLRKFILMHHYIASFVAGDAGALDVILNDNWMHHVTYAKQTIDQVVPPVMARSVLFLDDVRACMDWGGVRMSAASALNRLVWKTPELNVKPTLPACHMMPHDVLPVAGIGLCRRHRIKKQVPRIKSVAVARVIRGSRRYIRRLKRSSFESFDEAKEWLSTVIDNSLRGGVRVGCYVVQPSGKEGAPTLPIWELTSCAVCSGVTAATCACTAKSQEDCSTETKDARLSMDPRNILRGKQTIIEDFLGSKKQWTTGAIS